MKNDGKLNFQIFRCLLREILETHSSKKNPKQILREMLYENSEVLKRLFSSDGSSACPSCDSNHFHVSPKSDLPT